MSHIIFMFPNSRPNSQFGVRTQNKSQQLLRKVPLQTSLNFTERRGIRRGMPCIIEVEDQVIFFCITKKTAEASLIRLLDEVNNNEMICHNQN